MPLILPLKQIAEQDKALVGGKGLSLAKLAKAGIRVPHTQCVTTDAYSTFVADHGLAERIQLEFNRKNFNDMRWEELWDMALRIRNLFLTLPMPADLEQSLSAAIRENFHNIPVAIRSSAPDEDAKSSSFAGLHESFINVKGITAILDHIKLVWASLWSDAALLYRQELQLDAEQSSMAVVIQEVVHGKSSGILFTRSPTNEKLCALEAVHGLNQALVDGLIEPDRWFVSRDDGKIDHMPAARRQHMIATTAGTELVDLPLSLQNRAPLTDHEVHHLIEKGLAIENIYHTPQDIEWTYIGDELVILQARPISTAETNDPMDKRPWYLSLHRSLDNLRDLQEKIEDNLLPAMARDADRLHEVDLQQLSDADLAEAIEKRLAVNAQWTNVYWEEFIPFAHGMRLFGQVYNDAVRPENPYEFVELLVHTPMESTNRNSMMEQLAEEIRGNSLLRNQLEQGVTSDFVDNDFAEQLAEFVGRYGDFSCSLGLDDHCRFELTTLIAVLLEMASHPSPGGQPIQQNLDHLLERYFQSLSSTERKHAEEILALGRASYRLRDDDNIFLGRIELEVARAMEEAHRRLEQDGRIQQEQQCMTNECIRAMREPEYQPKTKQNIKGGKTALDVPVKARQLIGQPAGPGMAQGKARVVQQLADLAELKKGEILICDAIEPNMTFIVPLAGAIVERRGGMLIHGAIIAREYGIPCVTGISHATELIHTGDRVSVDGYLGILTIKT